MRPPCEMVQREFLPHVRASLASKLAGANMSQSDIARRMSITQAAVSKYLSQESTQGQLSEPIGALADRLSTGILNGASTDDELVREICSTCMSLRIGSTICTMHREKVPSLGELNCQICTGLLGGTETTFTGRAQILQDMQEALKLLEGAEGFPRVMPQVRANLVACDESARSLADVAAFPGRITVVGNRAKALTVPQFGASRHTATLLLWARGIWPRIRSCLGISGKDEVLQVAQRKGLLTIRLDEPASNPDEISDAAGKATQGLDSDSSTIGIHVPGGVGIEPILYLFGPSATSLSKTCISIGEEL
ncbi:MAG: thiamine-phosphate synthase family protein [Candidatus Thorarchaeota archaeon]